MVTRIEDVQPWYKEKCDRVILGKYPCEETFGPENYPAMPEYCGQCGAGTEIPQEVKCQHCGSPSFYQSQRDFHRDGECVELMMGLETALNCGFDSFETPNMSLRKIS